MKPYEKSKTDRKTIQARKGGLKSYRRSRKTESANREISKHKLCEKLGKIDIEVKLKDPRRYFLKGASAPFIIIVVLCLSPVTKAA